MTTIRNTAHRRESLWWSQFPRIISTLVTRDFDTACSLVALEQVANETSGSINQDNRQSYLRAQRRNLATRTLITLKNDYCIIPIDELSLGFVCRDREDLVMMPHLMESSHSAPHLGRSRTPFTVKERSSCTHFNRGLKMEDTILCSAATLAIQKSGHRRFRNLNKKKFTPIPSLARDVAEL